MKKIFIVVGTRPNFIKITQFRKAAEAYPNLEIKIVHTGQHYDDKMANVFFEQFKMIPDFFLNVHPGSPNTQIASTMLELEKLFAEHKPEYVMVVGDVNSTLAGAITANKMGLKLIHLESGLRSFDKTMPEEINRIITDRLSDYCLVTEKSGMDNLSKEQKSTNSFSLVGNTMIDTMVAFEKEINASKVLDLLNVKSGSFVLMTMHRPINVDTPEGLTKISEIIDSILKREYKIVFSIHPRTLNKIETFGLSRIFKQPNVITTEPLDYFSFQKLIKECKFIITDSGGIQEESTFRLKPCLTFRPNTERPSTVNEGTNILIDFDMETIQKCIHEIEIGTFKKGNIPELWDGKSTERILKLIASPTFKL